LLKLCPVPIRTYAMMHDYDETESATGVALAVFDFIRLHGDEIVYDVNAAIRVIQAYGDRRERGAARRARGGKVVQLRLVRRAEKLQPSDCF
jgi:hypothetical protein